MQTFEEYRAGAGAERVPGAKGDAAVCLLAGLPLTHGLYKVDIVIKDVNNPDHVGTWRRSINVPRYDEDQLGHSSLILADDMYRVPSKEIGAGNFVIGNTHVRPRVAAGGSQPVIFKRDQKLNFWMQVYNLGIGRISRTARRFSIRSWI